VKVTEVRFFADRKDPEVGFGSFTLDGEVSINYSVKRAKKDNSRFVALPSRKDKDGNYKSVVYIKGKELYNHIQEAVMAEVNKGSSSSNSSQPQQSSQGNDDIPF
jgi:DNA-binding cell septation regulator SpoVG